MTNEPNFKISKIAVSDLFKTGYCSLMTDNCPKNEPKRTQFFIFHTLSSIAIRRFPLNTLQIKDLSGRRIQNLCCEKYLTTSRGGDNLDSMKKPKNVVRVAKMPIRLGDNTMRSTKLLISVVILTSVLWTACAFAVDEMSTTPPAPQVSGKPADVQYPFLAEVIGTDVYVRSGNSTADYPCIKLNTPDKVTVVGEEYGWAKILPPPGCYSWIYKAYVKVDPANPTVGVLTGENVRVWAGTDSIEAGRSSGLQTKLNTGEIVELFPNQPDTGEYYRIKPPVGAYLWINAEFLKFSAPLKQDKPIAVPPRPDMEKNQEPIPPSNEQKRPTFTNLDGQTPQAQPAVSTTEEPKTGEEPKVEKPKLPNLTAKENELIAQCQQFTAQIDDELKKPLDEQNYAPVKESLEKMKQDPEAGKAAMYAQLLLDRIGRYELAKNVAETLKQQDQQLKQAKQAIEKAHQEQLNEIPKEVEFLYTGTLKPSHVYTGKTGTKRYLLMDSAGKILCYMIAASPEIDAQFQQKENTKISINGGVVSNAKSAVPVISVTQVAAAE